MRILHRHVLREWFISFVGAYLVLVALLILEDVYKSFHAFIKAGTANSELAKYCLALVVSFVPLITPVAIFISVLFALGSLHRKNEITAMRCAGLSIWEISKPLIISGIVLSALNLGFEALLTPIAVDKITSFRVQTDAKAKLNTVKRDVGFYNHLDHRIWLFKSFDKALNCAREVTVNCCDDNGREIFRVFAKSARFVPEMGYWSFTDGNVTYFSGPNDVPSNIELFSEKTFEAFTEPPNLMLVSLKKAKHLSFSEVVNSMKYAGKTAASNVFAVKFHKTFASAMSCLVVLLLAIPFSVMGMRVSPLVNLSKAVAFLMIFLVFGVIFTSLGNKGILPSPVAAWGMNILILFPIIKFFRRAM